MPCRHRAGATAVEGYSEHPLPPLAEIVDLYERASLPARRAWVGAIALNTRDLDERAARDAVTTTQAETGLPTDDPVRFGADRLLDAVLAALRRRLPQTAARA